MECFYLDYYVLSSLFQFDEGSRLISYQFELCVAISSIGEDV